MAAFKLPTLQARLPIVDGEGRPIPWFLRFFNIEFVGAIERQEASQEAVLAALAQAQADIIVVQDTQQDEIDRLNRVLAGTEAFTAVNVDSVIIAENAGLSDAIVSTESIALDAVTTLASDVDPTNVDVNYTTPVTIQTQVVTVGTGQAVEILGTCYLRGQGNGLGPSLSTATVVNIMVYRDSTLLISAPAMAIIHGISLQQAAIAPYIDFPSAGTYTYTIRASVDTPANTSGVIAATRYISAKVYKR